MARSITELELVATPKDESKLLLMPVSFSPLSKGKHEREIKHSNSSSPPQPITQSLRTFCARFPSLTHVYLTGFLESFSPFSLTQTNAIAFALDSSPLYAFLTLVNVEFPRVERVE